MDFSSTVRSREPSATLQLTARAKELQKAGRDIVALSAGQPDFPSPRAAVEAAEKAMRGGMTGYTATPGIPELREIVAAVTSRRRGLEWRASNVVVSCGAKHSLANLLMAAVEKGDGVLLPSPYWVSYPEMVKLAGGRPVLPRSGSLLISAADVREAASSGVKGVILNSPGNPTGLVAGPAHTRELAEAIAETGVWCISDDIYEDLVYLDGPAPHILDYRPGLAERTAVVSGVSKTYSMTGWRIGWAVAPETWTRMAARIQEHTTSNPNSIAQYASLAVLSGAAEEERVAMLASFRARRDLMCDLLAAVPALDFTKPDGAFYVFPRVLSPMGADSSALSMRLLDEFGLAVIPGSAFGAEGYLRLSFAASERDIREGAARLRACFEKGSA
ncbi:pyridoxal phosphate-dependent aminotransferase [Candidatus Fermentibacteria bacterium]|nr:pyridoxal phosphate-dependent aminotransferase [Candidatus Fermentibacteria bacterium]